MRSAKDRPQTRVKKPEPTVGTDAWLIWAAWADRITFEEIKEKTGLTESNVIKKMQRLLAPKDFRRWRKRANTVSIKHRRKFQLSRHDEDRWDTD
ncbi:MAG: TIGR03643 family protein [Myxococcota bacterium]|nr:TIGR03643 family protein [Myxococcota bacterium]